MRFIDSSRGGARRSGLTGVLAHFRLGWASPECLRTTAWVGRHRSACALPLRLGVTGVLAHFRLGWASPECLRTSAWVGRHRSACALPLRLRGIELLANWVDLTVLGLIK
ncbi:MAG: hypothetical protein RL240_587 [Planctomycetota bacterium]